jgi:hypothetical protein
MKTIAKQLNIKKFPFKIKDSDGKVIYREDSDGYWEKQEWDGGKVIYREDSDGYWEKQEWDGDKVIYWEDSNGFWVKREWAGGEMIRYENSDGIIEDNRPKTDVQKAIDLLTKEGLLRDGKIQKLT